MGLFVVPSPQLATTDDIAARFNSADYDAFAAVIERAAPSWARCDDEFDGAAHLCMTEVLLAFDPTRGVPVEAFLYMRAQSRVSTLLARWRRARAACGLDDLTPAQLAAVEMRLAGSRDDTTRVVEDRLSLDAFLATLTDRQREVAILISEGASPVEVASTLGVTVSAVCNCLRAMRPKAAAFYGNSSAAIAVAAA